jgi:hypothetical protein
MLKLQRVSDFLLLEQEFIRNHEVFKPREARDKEEWEKMEEVRTPAGQIIKVEKCRRHLNLYTNAMK